MSDEVSDFLRSIEELKERREEEDEARSRELEEKILKEKRERQARRAERARSISPQKSSPASTPTQHLHIAQQPSNGSDVSPHSEEIEIAFSERSQARRDSQADAMDRTREYSTSSSPTKENDSPFDSDIKRTSLTLTSPSSGIAPSRSPLSWQRRPPSQASDRSRSRPLSMMAAENAAARSSPTLPDMASPGFEQNFSRDQMAQSLAGKDPTWFRQTADRGQTSAAYRRNQVEDPDLAEMSSKRTQLPGMSRDAAAEGSRWSSSNSSPQPSSPAFTGRLGSPLTLSDAQRLEPSRMEYPLEMNAARPPSPDGRTSPTRPVSPTKGMGGFVQSAMMKRTDSVKRWSVTSPTGLQRADSVVSSNRSAVENAPRTSVSNSRLRDGSTTPVSRPTSRAGDETRHDGPLSPGESTAAESRHQEEVQELPVSPTKTMDQRRWSPTKSSSWLDAALNKQESPKPRAAPPLNSQQPAWMVELNKAKAQKAGTADVGRTASMTTRKHEVKTGGLMRSTPINVKPPAVALVGIPHVPTEEMPPPGGFRGTLSRSTSSQKSDQGHDEQVTTTRVKPATPPKPDFRANLKPRAPPSNNNSSEHKGELENVLGTLRRTKTQNYKAPDLLKSNILQGKAALNSTGGPKNTERKDALQEAILKKKEEIKKAQGSSRPSSMIMTEKTVPEGLAKALEIKRSDAAVTRPKSGASIASLDVALNPADTRRPSSPMFEKQVSTPTASSPLASPPLPRQNETRGRPGGKLGGTGGLAERFNPALAGILARGPPGMASGGSERHSTGQSASREPTGPGPQLSHMTKNRARGPRRKAPTSVAKPEGERETAEESKASPREQPSPLEDVAPTKREPSPTRARSRSPTKVHEQVAALAAMSQQRSRSPEFKDEPVSQPPSPRKLDTKRMSRFLDEPSQPSPTADPEKARPSSPEKGLSQPWPEREPEPEPEPEPETFEPLSPVRPLSPVKSRPLAEPTKVEPAATGKARPLAELEKVEASPVKPVFESRPLPDALSARPPSPIKSTSLPAPIKVEPPAPVPRTTEPPEPLPVRPLSPVKSRPLPEPLKVEPLAPSKARPVPEVEKIESVKPLSETRPLPDALPARPPSPIKSLSLPDKVEPLASAPRNTESRVKSRPLPEPLSLTPRTLVSAQNGTSSPSAPAEVQQKAPTEKRPMERTPTSPLKGARPLPVPPQPVSQPSSPMRSPTKHGFDVSAMLTDFFGPDRPRRNYVADAAALLMRRPSLGPKIKTQNVQMFRVTRDGKSPVPSHSERVLFEREMYLCMHTFSTDSGFFGKKATEVYFWVGNHVPESEVNEAQGFVQKEAKSAGGKLIKITQGKESPELMQALGGIIIVRRGSSSKYDSLASNMLCGRRYLGQVAFDEVEFSPVNLCSGFPYLITHNGACYLWKGKGCDTDELGCARLVGMELGLTGELTEVEDGNEPATFWHVFGGDRKPSSADHWRLKPNYDKYCTRLFWSNPADKQQIIEISPFSQSDLSASDIYILDAFFELYIIVGARSQHQYTAFGNALDFAQEYAILAAGMEDRPFVPISTVVLEGIPRDLKSVFRCWNDAASPTVTNPDSPATPGPMKRGRSLRIVPLNQALQALAE